MYGRRRLSQRRMNTHIKMMTPIAAPAAKPANTLKPTKLTILPHSSNSPLPVLHIGQSGGSCHVIMLDKVMTGWSEGLRSEHVYKMRSLDGGMCLCPAVLFPDPLLAAQGAFCFQNCLKSARL